MESILNQMMVWADQMNATDEPVTYRVEFEDTLTPVDVPTGGKAIMAMRIGRAMAALQSHPDFRNLAREGNRVWDRYIEERDEARAQN